MDRIDCDLALGLHEQLIGELQTLVGEHPLQERLRGQLMVALYRAGRQADALRAYRDARATLVDELGIEPSPSLQRLEKAILNHDSSLEAPAPAREERDATKPSTHRRRGVAIAGVVLAAIASVVAVVATRGSPGPAAAATVRPDSVAVVDPRTNTIVADIALHAWPAAVAFGGGSLWVATKDNHTLLQIDPRSHRVTRTFGLGAEPSTIAVDRRYVWVLFGVANTLVEFDGDTGTLVRRVRLTRTIRGGPFKGRVLRFPDPLRLEEVPNPDLAVGGGAAWIGFGYGVVARVDAKRGDVEQITAGSAHGVAFGDRAVWSVSDSLGPPAPGTISRIDVRTRAVTELPMQGLATAGIFGIAAGPGDVWAIDAEGRQALKVDPDLRRITAVVPLDHAPAYIALGNGAVWTANADGTLSRLDERTGALVETISLGRYPRKAYPVDLATGDGAVWVAVH
jgi:DNA-binding beta-propeller fold protein YncE